MDLQSIYEYTLRREYGEYEFFLQNAARMRHASAADIFRELAQEEEAHIVHLKALKAAEADADDEPPTIDLQAEGAYAQRAGAELLDDYVLESMIPDIAVLRVAYLMERDLAEFYATVAERLDESVRPTFRALAEWERQHEALFQRLHARLFEEYTGLQWPD